MKKRHGRIEQTAAHIDNPHQKIGPHKPDRLDFLGMAFLAILVVIAYIPAFGSGYIFDDRILIQNNPAIRDLGNIPAFFVSKDKRIPIDFSGLQTHTYRPLQSVSYAISYALWKDSPRAFHAENIVIHILNGILVYILCVSLIKKRAVSWAVAALFLVHPVQVEAVTYIADRAILLATFFFLLSLLSYIRSRGASGAISKTFFAASLLLFTAAIFSKEMAVTLPLILILYLFLVEDENRPATTFYKKASGILPYFAILAAFLFIRSADLGKISQVDTPAGMGSSFKMMPMIFAEYLKLIFFPIRLTFYHDFDILSGTATPSYIYAALITLSFLAVCVVSLKKDRRMAFYLLSYLAALLPVSNIIPLIVLMQERFLYLPSIFILSAIVVGSHGLKKMIFSEKKAGSYIAAACLVFILALFAARTYSRNLDWKDQRTLVAKESHTHPNKGMFDFDLGIASFRQKRYDEAIGHLKKALEKEESPIHRTMTYDTLGNCYREKKELKKAIESYNEALKITPDYVHSLNTLGDIYFKRGEYQTAYTYFKRSVEIWPKNAMFNKNLASASIMLGKRDEAIKYWRRSLELNPAQPDVARFIRENE